MMMGKPAEIASIDAPDVTTYLRDIVPQHRPVVMRGLVARWPIVAAGRAGPAAIATYLKAIDSGQPTTLFTAAPDIGGRFFYSNDLRGLNFKSHPIALSDLLDRLVALVGTPDPPSLYAGATPAAQSATAFAAANPLPLPTPGGEPRIWIGNATQTATHYDGSHNVACVVGGARRFILFPPEQVANLYIGPVDRTPAGQPVSMVDPLAPDLARYPRFAEAWKHAQYAELVPGDALFIPSLWWHHVQSTEPLNVMVNYWYRDGPNTMPFAAMMHGVASIRDLPLAERTAWRAWFDHYVFSADAVAAVAHLPDHAQGVLAPPSPGRNQMIKAYLMKILSRL
ncbi:cupin-like domain-containing protein [Sphingomonas sp. Tas61C01]|uniref:cupin-like domain-containing protein n=1 Tax=Sphingomonas sp. Tas61C01 TaxID=3458297 RepID=UPI00403EE19D